MKRVHTGWGSDQVVIAFYGVNDDDSACSLFFHHVVGCIRELGCEPTHADLSRLEDVGSELQVFSEGEHLGKTHDVDGVMSVEVYAVNPESDLGWLDAIVGARYSRCPIVGNFALLFANSSVLTLESSLLHRFAAELTSILEPAYGISYTQPVAHGPSRYAVGIYVARPGDLTRDGREYALRVSRWGAIGMNKQVYRSGLLRGVYPRNYLAQVHLDQMVDGVRLSEWILQDAWRGTLADQGHRLKLWSVDVVNAQAVEGELWNAGLVFDWRRHS